MQAVSDQFKAAVNAATRHIDVMLTVLNRSGTERVYTSNDALLSLKIVDGKTTGGFGLGGTICPSLTTELHKSAVVAVNDKITVQIVVKDGGNLTLASEFSVDDIKRRPDGTMQITALGLMIKLSKNHVSSITYPATQYQLLSEIAARAGTQLHPTLESRLINNPTIESAPLKGKAEDGTTLYYTRRELLGYAAAINGGSAIIDQYGYLDIVRFTDTGEVIGADRAFREDITDSYEITDIAWNTTGLSYALDDDFDNGMVEFYNPLNYADSERDTIISNLDSELVGFGYEGATIQKQGCGYFQVGDVVTYKDIGGTNHTLLIMGIVYSFSDGYFTETLYSLASSENRRQYAGNEVVSNQIGGGQAQPIAPSAAMTEYEYISDSSVKYNGVTYSVEKNDNGLISKISDDYGNEFKPTISGEISDVALHNAVFWAVAMHSGISRNYYDDTLTPMVQYRYNVGRYTASGADIELLNQADGAALPLVFEGATLNSDNVYIVGNTSSCGYIDYTAPAGELNECTTYLVAKGATTNALRFAQAPSTYSSYGAGEGFISEFGQWCAGAQANATSLRSGVSITSVSVLALRHVGDTLHFYVNGKYIGTCPTPAIPVTAGKFWMGITAGMYYDGGGYHYYDFAFAESAHSEADIIKNSKYLMWQYGVK